jgi:AraC-like DNA-binding protein
MPLESPLVRRADYQNPGMRAAERREADGAALRVDPGLGRRLACRTLWAGLGLEVVETAWERGRFPDRGEAHMSYAAIEVMRSGCFELRAGGERVLADPAVVLFHEAGSAFEVRHPTGAANAGTTFRIGPAALESLMQERRAGSSHGAAFASRAVPSRPALRLAVQAFSARVERGRDDALACEEQAVELVHAAAEAAVSGRLTRTATSACRRRALAVQVFLNEHCSAPLRLADVARAAGCSEWHVSRQFRAATGSSIHRWLLRLRLGHALEALRAGADDLTALALRTGFSSHSHFSSAFGAEFGLSPRAARARLAPRGACAHRRPGRRTATAGSPSSP